MPIGKKDDVIIRFGGDDSRFSKVADGVRRKAGSMGDNLRGVGASISSFFGVQLAGGLAAVAAGLTALAKSALSTADNIAKVSDKVGVNIEDLQRLRYAAKASGLEQNALDKSLQKFSSSIADAANGTGALFDELSRLGIPIRDANGGIRDTVDILGDYADATQQADSNQEQLRLAVKAFGEEGAGMVNVLRNGDAGMKELMATANSLGLVLDDNLVRQSEALNQAWDDFTDRVSTRFKSALLSVVSWVDELAGNYRTLESVTGRLAEAHAKLEKTEKQAAGNNRRLAGIAQGRIKGIKEEIAALDEKAKALKAIEDLKKASREVGPSSGTVKKAPAAKSATSAVEDGFVTEKISLTESATMRADALKRFRTGEISDTQLGAERARIKYLRGEISESDMQAKQIISARGAYGTRSNTVSGAEAVTKKLETGPDIDFLNDQFRAWFASHEFAIKVRPELVGAEGIDIIARDAADKIGAKE